MPFTRKTGRPESYCNASIDFDPDALEEIKADLEFAWPNWPKEAAEEEASKWELEWKKFGTCIAEKVDTMSTIQDLFKKGSLD